MNNSEKSNTEDYTDKLHWITSAGGPLLLLEATLLSHWEGIYSTDYNRACSINDYLDLISVGNGWGLVLWEEPMPTTWISDADNAGGTFIRWQWANDESDVLEAVSNLNQVSWTNTEIMFTLSANSLVLFDAACPGKIPDCNETGCRLDITMTKGRYQIKTAYHEPNEDTALVLHRFTFAQ